MIAGSAIVVAYLIGSLSFAVIVSRAFGLPDPHSYGSGNPGATNVLRTGRKAAAVLTLAGDAGKGYAAVLLARAAVRYGAPEAAIAACALACFAGHLWPVFFGLRGGKGVATAGGILLAVDPWVGGGVLAAWALVALVFRISSLAALVAALFAPFWYLWLHGTDPMLAALVAIALLLIYRHRANLRRLLAGEEHRIGGDGEHNPSSGY